MILVFLGLALVSTISAILSSAVNKGNCNWLWVVVVGVGVSTSWALLSKYSANIIRDGLLWDVIVAMIYCLVFIILGHATNFGVKHWIGVVITFGVFIYWSVI